MIPKTTPMCDEAREIPDFRERLQHYRKCTDSRCQGRAKAAKDLGRAIAEQMRKGGSK